MFHSVFPSITQSKKKVQLEVKLKTKDRISCIQYICERILNGVSRSSVPYSPQDRRPRGTVSRERRPGPSQSDSLT